MVKTVKTSTIVILFYKEHTTSQEQRHGVNKNGASVVPLIQPALTLRLHFYSLKKRKWGFLLYLQDKRSQRTYNDKLAMLDT